LDVRCLPHRRLLSFPQRYVLFVATIEIRKNHRLLVRVWRRLLERRGADAVPVLIFAGQIGWLVDDLLGDLTESNYLGGKIVLMPGLSDAELCQAYRSCLFTVFPSLCEGWGLPIAESLAHGKFCVASNRAPIPEVVGDFIDYFDPSDDDDALAKIERLLDPGYLTAREARLRAEYHPRTWADCVHGLIGKLESTGTRGPSILRRAAGRTSGRPDRPSSIPSALIFRSTHSRCPRKCRLHLRLRTYRCIAADQRSERSPDITPVARTIDPDL
jgi:glycosyltransferase involved in cell wall biosynthesis